MNLRTLNIAARCMLGFGFLACLVAVIGCFGLWKMDQIQQENRQIQEAALPGLLSSDALALQLARMRVESLRLQMVPDPQQIAGISQKIAEIRQRLEQELDSYRKIARQENEKQLLQQFQAGYQGYLANLEKTMALVRQNPPDLASRIPVAEMASQGGQMSQAAEQLRQLNQTLASQSWEKAARLYQSSKVIIILTLLAAIAAALLMAWRMTLSLVQPISTAVSVATTIASGDLTRQLDTRGTDEAARLMKALEQMQQALRSTLERIASSADQLASATEEMSSAMQQSTQNLQQQNSEIEMAATAVTEMSQAVDEVASNASSASEESRTASTSASQGQKQLNDTLEAIQQLASHVMGASEEARALEAHTHSISQVLDVIRSVAEQTNLLALNAAIEAARAGEAGRGFAVVADEVRALAHRTSESTTEIENMIATIQTGTSHTVEALLSSADQARQTQEQAHAANQALNTITQAIQGIDQRNLVIASAAEEQAQVAREVDKNLVRIRDLSLQTSAGAGQTQTASHELSRLASDLAGMIRKFHL